ncbi:hypothetical protein FB107DRAFT_216275 [Schizophyllum commune]
MRKYLLPLPALLLPSLTIAQTCENYGVQNGSSCACPVGFGGESCSDMACGGTIFDGAQRSLTTHRSGAFANLTASDCSCEDGWTGTGCNVCQISSACQAWNGASSSSSSLSDTTSSIQNSTLVCNTAPRVYASSQMSCDVKNPTLQAIFPLSSTLNIMRTLDPSLSPLPNVTSFGASMSVYAQLIYDGVEQFYCTADSCTQDFDNSTNKADWSCQNLQCTCRTNTSFCGGVSISDITQVINGLSGELDIDCETPDSSGQAACSFKQSMLTSLFGADGLSLSGCRFGECVRQYVIDNASDSSSSNDDAGSSLSAGVIAGLAVVGALVGFVILFIIFGCLKQRRARRTGHIDLGNGGVGIEWRNLTYTVAGDKTVLDDVTGAVRPGQIVAILGPSGAGKTTLVEILAGKAKSGDITGGVTYTGTHDTNTRRPRIGFVPQQDVLPSMLTVREALLFAARLRLPEALSDIDKAARVDALIERLGLSAVASTRIGGARTRGISGGEMRRVSIGLELVGCPDVLILDEPTSGLDSVSAARIANVLRDIAHDPARPTAVVASIHQPSSQLYHAFDGVVLLAHGNALYAGHGRFGPVDYFRGREGVGEYPEGYNVADYLLEIASDAPAGLFHRSTTYQKEGSSFARGASASDQAISEKTSADDVEMLAKGHKHSRHWNPRPVRGWRRWSPSWATLRVDYATTFLTQIEVLSGREWKILRRDKTLCLAHIGIASVLGVFCGGLYYHTDQSIAGFQSRVGCLFFVGALIAFSSLSALFNVVQARELFLRERSSGFYSPTAWLATRILFDVVPLRLLPTIIVSTITYWMAGLADDAAHFFKYLFILVLYTLAITLWNFFLGTLFENGGVAILLSALSALYQMTFAGFFVHLTSIPPVLRWLQWLCPLKYCLEALSVNEVGAGLMIEDTLEGVPVNVSASLIMEMLFGFKQNAYYRDVLVLFAFIAGFGIAAVMVVWLKVRERR